MEAEVHQLNNGETVYNGEYTTPDGTVHAAADYDGEGTYIISDSLYSPPKYTWPDYWR